MNRYLGHLKYNLNFTFVCDVEVGLSEVILDNDDNGTQALDGFKPGVDLVSRNDA